MTQTKRRTRYAALAGLVVLVVYLVAWPVPIHPVAWHVLPDPGFAGRFAPTHSAESVTRLAQDVIGPEALTFDSAGVLYTGLLDGRIVRVDAQGGVTDFVNTGGRPLGMVFGPDGTLYVADVYKGLLAISTEGTIRVLVDPVVHHMAFVDDVDILPNGHLIFTDASNRFSLDEYKLDLLEHRPRGRLFEYDPVSGRLARVASGFYFANGVAASVDGSYALVCETGALRVRKVELNGARRGHVSTLIEGLPGFCDNIRRAPSEDQFWVAMPSPRDALLDAMADKPFLRSVVVRLPEALQPAPKTTTHFMRLAGDGTVTALISDTSEGSYGPVTTAIEHDGAVFLGSLSAHGLARIDGLLR